MKKGKKPMNELTYQQQILQDQIILHPIHKSYWKQIKPTLSFWLCLILILAGFTYYRATVNFLFAPHAHLKQSTVNIRIHHTFTTINHKL